jgi:hypothetical protein
MIARCPVLLRLVSVAPMSPNTRTTNRCRAWSGAATDSAPARLSASPACKPLETIRSFQNGTFRVVSTFYTSSADQTMTQTKLLRSSGNWHSHAMVECGARAGVGAGWTG